MTTTRLASLCVAVLLMVAACGGRDAGSVTSDTDRPPDWGSGMTYDDCTEKGLTDYGPRTGQKWIGDFHADLYLCKALTTTPTEPTAQPTTTPTESTAQPTPAPTESTAQPTTDSTLPPVAEPETTSTQAPTGSTTTLPPLRGLRYERVFSDVRTVLDDENAMPLQVTGTPGGRYNYLITREGRVWIMEEGAFFNSPVLDLRDSIAIGAETGLLGIAIHPTDPQRMFLNYTDLEFDLILAEYQLDGSLRTAIPSSARTILKIPTRSDFHKGGMIMFGPDGYLYIGVGDDGYSFNGQDHTTWLGSILRIDVDSGEPYGIPTDQPPLSEEAPEVYLYGLRNPWRFWIDPATNIIYIGDVGADSYEEIDITSLDAPGTNFGWSWLEGPQWGPLSEGVKCRENPESCDTSEFTAAALALSHSPEVCAVIGGMVYRGTSIPELTGTYFYSDACGGFLRSLRWNGTLAVDLQDWTEQVEAQKRVLSFGVDTAGEIYVMTADEVLRLAPVR